MMADVTMKVSDPGTLLIALTDEQMRAIAAYVCDEFAKRYPSLRAIVALEALKGRK